MKTTITLKGTNAILYARTCGTPLVDNEPGQVFTIAITSWSSTAKLLHRCNPTISIPDSNPTELNLALDLENKGLLYTNSVEGNWRRFEVTELGRIVYQIEKLRIDLAHYLSD